VRSLFTIIKNFFWPKEVAVRLRRIELTFWAFLLALAYLPLPLGFIAWFALVRPLIIISKLSGRDVFKAAYFYAFMANLFQLYWIAVVTPPGMVTAIFILSLYPAVVLSAFTVIYRYRKILGLIALPFLWIGMEYFRSLTQFAFPWTDLAYSQGYYLTFIQSVSVIGSYGLSFAVVLFNIFIWQAISKSNRLEHRVSAGIAFPALAIILYLYGWVVFPPYPEKGDIQVSLLQGNVDLATKWLPQTRDRNFELYDSLSHEVAGDSADLIIWPETAAPCYPRAERRYRQMLSSIVSSTGTKHLIGALDVLYVQGKEKTYNAAFQFLPDGRVDGVYHKVNLVPFSEHVPYQEHLRFLSRDYLARYLDFIKTRKVQWWSDFYPGDSIVLFDVGNSSYSVLICFESAFPDYVRESLLKGAEFVVNITNDTWFGRSPGPYQHMRMAVFRAVENRVWVARCANSGITAVIDPYGREIDRAGLYVRDIVSADIYPLEEYSVFTKVGPIVGLISALIMAAIYVILLVIWLAGKLSGKSLFSSESF
jgi:apolipoprotein N-acyltransferase